MQQSEYVIVIHCTHGVNRAGYMVTRYLMDRLGVPAPQAIDIVSEARGHTMNRNSYLKVLVDEEVLEYAREQARYRNGFFELYVGCIGIYAIILTQS